MSPSRWLRSDLLLCGSLKHSQQRVERDISLKPAADEAVTVTESLSGFWVHVFKRVKQEMVLISGNRKGSRATGYNHITIRR